jgi:hypothetical protein
MIPRMRTAIACALASSLAAAPVLARADPMGCLVGPADNRPCSLGGTAAGILGAIAAPVILAGAAVTVAEEIGKKTEERLPDGAATPTATNRQHARPNLALVPDPPDPYRASAGKKETRAKPSAAFQFNETATNVAIAATGAMVVGAIIGEIVHDSTQHHK